MSAIFPKLEGLDSLARRDGVDIQPTLLRVLTDLYVQKATHTSEEERHYTELALRLIDRWICKPVQPSQKNSRRTQARHPLSRGALRAT